MPPKANKKKKKTSKSSIKLAVAIEHQKSLNTQAQTKQKTEELIKSTTSMVNPTSTQAQTQSLDEQVDELSRAWEVSPQRQRLVHQVRNLILTHENIFLDNALCLGLGSLEHSTMAPLESWGKAIKNSTPSTPDDFLSAAMENLALGASTVEGDKDLPLIGAGKAYNRRLYQLLIFESTIHSISEKFNIKSILIQDPAFTQRDREFLTRRGHEILDFDTNHHGEMDPRLSISISTSTFCYLPYCYLPATIEVIHTAQPSLYLGPDLLDTMTAPWIREAPNLSPFIEDKIYDNWILASDFQDINALGYENFGFMFPTDLKNERAIQRMQQRNLKVWNMKLELNDGIYRSIKQGIRYIGRPY